MFKKNTHILVSDDLMVETADKFTKLFNQQRKYLRKEKYNKTECDHRFMKGVVFIEGLPNVETRAVMKRHLVVIDNVVSATADRLL